MKSRRTLSLRLVWERTAPQFRTIIERDDGLNCAIVTQVHKRKWFVFALTTPKKTLDDALKDHAHKVIGDYKTLREAMLAAESWAAHWLKGHKVTNAKKCLCQEMKIA